MGRDPSISLSSSVSLHSSLEHQSVQGLTARGEFTFNYLHSPGDLHKKMWPRPKQWTRHTVLYMPTVHGAVHAYALYCPSPQEDQAFRTSLGCTAWLKKQAAGRGSGGVFTCTRQVPPRRKHSTQSHSSSAF